MHTFRFLNQTFEATVVSITGREGLNELYEFTATVRIPRDEIEHALHGGREGAERVFLGERVALTMQSAPPGVTRYGIVSDVSFEGTDRVGSAESNSESGAEFAQFRLRVVPRVWLLNQRRNTRIFQQLYLHQIVSAVLSEWNVPHRWNLQNTYPRRVYCTQYEETDLEFVRRLLAEEGVFFYFDHAQQFAAAGALTNPHEVNEHAERAGTVGAALSGVGAGASKLGQALDQKWLAIGGGGAGLLGDAVSAFGPEVIGEEDPVPDKFPPASAGPPDEDTDVFVFADAVEGYAMESPGLTLVRRNDAAMVGADDRVITHYAVGGRIRPQRVETRDYDFRRPLLVLRSTLDAEAAQAIEHELTPAEIYDHHGEYETPDINSENVRLHLQQHRADAYTDRGESFSPAILPGHVFTLDNQTGQPVPEGDFAVVRVYHEALSGTSSDPAQSAQDALIRGCAEAIAAATNARAGALSEQDLATIIRRTTQSAQERLTPYRNRFECVPSSFAFRPARPPRVYRRITETATVVGPPGQDIYTDRFGRIKVQFHWDRENKWDDKSSCWVRVAQPWSGAGYGFQFIPRVGMEVVVTFVAGDPDRPVVIGTLYNGTHATPEPLPERMTRSSIRSQRSPGGGAFNEIAFDDAEGTERLILHGAKDMEFTADGAHAVAVRDDHTVTVGGSQRVGVAGDQITGVGGNRGATVGRDDSASVGGSRTTRVAKHETHSIDGSHLETVRGSAARIVRGDALELVDGTKNTVVHGDVTVNVSGTTPNAMSHANMFVSGVAQVSAGLAANIMVPPSLVTDDSWIQLSVGDSYLLIKKDSIELRSKEITVRGDELTRVGIPGSRSKWTKDNIDVLAKTQRQVTGEGAELHLDGSKAALLGQRIMLQPVDVQNNQEDPATATEEPNLLLKFTHKDLGDGKEPIANTPYRLVAGSRVYTGKETNDKGEIDVFIAPKVKSVEVTLFANEKFPKLYPHGPLHYVVQVLEEFPEWNKVPGTRARLTNLGFAPGGKLTDGIADPTLELAVAQFTRMKNVEAELFSDAQREVKNEFGS